jgi:citrate lyase beta subunit
MNSSSAPQHTSYLSTHVSKTSPLELGATLYTPATHPRLKEIISGELLPEARSLVLCTEDAISEGELTTAIDNIARALDEVDTVRSQCFIRPRNASTLKRVISLIDTRRFRGVVIPKVDEHNILHYAEVLALAPHLYVMPTIESEVAFYRDRLDQLRIAFTHVQNPILSLRIGGNDLFKLLGMKRPPSLTIYETPLRTTINDLIVTFRPAGYELSAPVFDYLYDDETLIREVQMDLAYGLRTKTAIHPRQIPVIETLYQVSQHDLNLAEAMINEQAPAVFQMSGQMCEPSTHRAWAQRLIARAQRYGVRD